MATSPSLAGSVRTVALVLAVLGYRRRLPRRDHWSRPRLLAHQESAAGVAAPTMKADWDFATWLPPSP